MMMGEAGISVLDSGGERSGAGIREGEKSVCIDMICYRVLALSRLSKNEIAYCFLLAVRCDL
jgi:hypothetical protein